MRKVNILGTEYTIEMVKPGSKDEEYVSDRRLDGFCDYIRKKIIVADISESYRYEFEYELDLLLARILRHEIVHAFLSESGLMECAGSVNCWARNEEIVDFFATQGPKIFKAFEELGIME